MKASGWSVTVAGVLFGGLLAYGIDHLSPKAPHGPPPPPPASAYKPTPDNDIKLQVFVGNVLAFVLLHEIGHMIVSEFKVPVLGREEDAADRFAIAVLTFAHSNNGPDELPSVAAFWDAIHRSEGNGEHFDWADEHGEPEQRAAAIICLMYGSDPQHYSELADHYGLSQERRQSCILEAKKNLKDWGEVHDASLNSDLFAKFGLQVPSIAIVYRPVPLGLSEDIGNALNSERSIVMKNHVLDLVGSALARMRLPYRQLGKMDVVTVNKNPGVQHPDPDSDLTAYDYVVQGDPCLDKEGKPQANARWKSGPRSLTLCYGLIDYIEQIGMSLIAESEAVKK